MPQYNSKVTTPYNLSDLELKTLRRVKDKINSYLDNEYRLLGQRLMEKKIEISPEQGQSALHQLEDQKQLMTDLADKVAIVLHLLKNDGVTRFSAKELGDLVLMPNNKTYNKSMIDDSSETVLSYGTDYTNPDIRKSLEKTIRYFAAFDQVNIVYALIDKKMNVLGYQSPRTVLLKNDNVAIKGLKLLPETGQYVHIKQDDGSFLCYKEGLKEQAIVLTPKNYKDHFAELYDIYF